MKNLIFLLLFFAGINLFAQETGSIKGKITEASTFEPVAAANIVIESLSKGAASDPNGKYIISKIKPGSYTVEVNAPGYKNVTYHDINVVAGKETELNIEVDKRVPFPDNLPVIWKSYDKDLSDKLKAPLEQIKKLDNNKYQELLRRTYFNSKRFPGNDPFKMYLSKMNDDIIELELKSEKLALEYKKAEDADKSRIKTELKNLLDDLFTRREELKKQEVEDLTKELKELKNSLELRSKNKSTIIQRRMDELLGNGDIYEW